VCFGEFWFSVVVVLVMSGRGDGSSEVPIASAPDITVDGGFLSMACQNLTAIPSSLGEIADPSTCHSLDISWNEVRFLRFFSIHRCLRYSLTPFLLVLC